MNNAITIGDDVAKTFADIRSNKSPLKWMICVINDGTQCAVEHYGDTEWDDFVSKVPVNEPRLIIFDLKFTRDERIIQKLLFIKYTPDECTTTQIKFQYANATNAFKQVCQPFNKELQKNDNNDLDRDRIIEGL